MFQSFEFFNCARHCSSCVKASFLSVVLQRIIRTCGEIKAAPSESEEIQFLCTVCAKLKTDPYLVNFFIEVALKNMFVQWEPYLQQVGK